MQSATEHPQVIDDYLHNETSEGRIPGPFSLGTMPGIHTNRIGVIPKKHQLGKWHLITDLSFPPDNSINDAVDPALCSLANISVDQVAITALQLGKGCLLAKVDIKAAYRLVPVHPLE